MQEKRLWTTAFPAPSRGQLGKQERRGEKPLTPSQEEEKTFKRDFSSPSHLYQEESARKPGYELFFPATPQQLPFPRRDGEASTDP